MEFTKQDSLIDDKKSFNLPLIQLVENKLASSKIDLAAQPHID